MENAVPTDSARSLAKIQEQNVMTTHSKSSAKTPAQSGSGMLSHQAFCPVGGLVDGGSSNFSREQQSLRNLRLKTAAIILCSGSFAFLMRNLALGLYSPAPMQPLGIGHAALVLILAGAAMFLQRCFVACRFRLLSLEFIIFGLPTLMFVWMQHCRTCECNPAMLEQMAAAYPAETAVPWIILINIYAYFVPNSLRRAVVVIGGMSVIPLAGAILVSIEQPVVRERMFGGGGFSALLLWLAISGVTAIHGSFRIGKLRREAYDAKQLGAYSLKRKLGAGGMGEVHLAEHQLLKRPCAIKLIRAEKADDATAIARFESEVQATAGLTHVNTVEIYDFGYTQDGTFYYAMEYLPGMDLQALVDQTGPMPVSRVVHLLKQVASALGEAHRAGLIHRDIKPGNIFATERGGVLDVAKLLDFGLVKSLDAPDSSPEITIEGAVIGSPMYAPPERVLGESEPDARGDIYSLGATAYFLLTGRPVFRGDKVLKVLFAHANESPVPLSDLRPDIPADVEAVIMQCLAKNPDARYQTAEELEAALAATSCATDWTQQQAKECWNFSSENHEPGNTSTAAEIETQVLA